MLSRPFRLKWTCVLTMSLILFALTILTITTPFLSQNNSSSELENSKLSKPACTKSNKFWQSSTNDTIDEIQCTEHENNEVSCEGPGHIQGINTFLLAYTKKQIKLTISACKFPSIGAMHKSWINVTHVDILEMVITNCTLFVISKDSFTGVAFQKMIRLELLDIRVSLFQEETFQGLSLLKILIISIQDVEFRAVKLLEPLKSLNSFEFRGITPDGLETININKFLKTSHSTNIVNLTLENLFIGFDFSSKKHPFEKFDKLKVLSLRNCKLEIIEKDTFEGLTDTLEYIDLSYNSLKNLPDVMFPELLAKSNFKMNLIRNEWNCDCGILPLANAYREYPCKFETIVKCRNPPLLDGRMIDEALMCSDLVQVTCKQENTFDCIRNELNNTISLQEPNIEYSFANVSSTSLKINVRKSMVHFAFIWFNKVNRSDSNKYNVECRLYNRSSNIIIEGLDTGNAYTFCGINKSLKIISPFNCQSLYMSAVNDSSNDTSLTYCTIPTYWFIYFAISTVLSATIGCLVMYFILRWKPILVRGSKRVILLKQDTQAIMVMPKNSNTTEEILKSISPYVEINPPTRRFSDSSIASTRSYMTAPKLYEIIQYKKLGPTNSNTFSENEEPVKKPTPPPLPRRCSKLLEDIKNNKSNNFIIKNDCIYATINKESSYC